jgi:selenide,water dikinase
MSRNPPVGTDLVLIGGGHSHVHVLKAFAMRPEPGVRLTLVTRDLETPYSGMLPGVIAGLYTRDEAHIDLLRLAAATGVRLIHAEAVGLDRAAKQVLLVGRPPLAYDIAAVDVGITPALATIEGAAKHAIAVKPIGDFLRKFDDLLQRCRDPDGPRRIAIIGGGAGGVELLLSVRSRLRADAAAGGTDPERFSFVLVTDGEILATHNARVRQAFRRILRERGIELHEHRRARAIGSNRIEFEDAPPLVVGAVLATTAAAPPPWFAGTGLALDPGGFLAVAPSLQVLNDPDVFASGDCAGLIETPREKAGVFAVRAGPPLAENLRRRARGESMKPWRPQRRYLALISTGERYAVASRGWFKTEGAWVWTLKDWIDRRWMRMYQDTDAMMARMRAAAGRNAWPATDREEMRCGGCGSKIGPDPLARALSRLAPALAGDVVIGLDAPDDAAVTAPRPGRYLVQTVDFFRAVVDDPYLFGEVAANHALSDIYAMGGEPRHALATAVIPPAPAGKVAETLFQLLAGVRASLDRDGVALVGGHSSEGAELAFGLSVTGDVEPIEILRKSGLRPGDALILTRPVGTGVLFAAAMQARARAEWIAAALDGMRRSNRSAAKVLTDHGATAMTDVTGFGLAGHLGELLNASLAEAMLDLTAVPLYDGTLDLARGGIASTLLPENLALARMLFRPADAVTLAVLFDPQTAGGLLAGVPQERAQACVAALHSAGHAHATVVGRVVASGQPKREAVIDVAGALSEAGTSAN